MRREFPADTEVRVKVGGKVFASTAGVLRHSGSLKNYFPKGGSGSSSMIEMEDFSYDSDGVLTVSWPSADVKAVPYLLRYLKMYWSEHMDGYDVAKTFPRDRALLTLLKREGSSHKITGLPEGCQAILEELDGKRPTNGPLSQPSTLEKVGGAAIIGGAAAFAFNTFLK